VFKLTIYFETVGIETFKMMLKKKNFWKEFLRIS